MALTGNELVTVDGLKALHDYNEEAYVKAENGQLYIDTLDGVGHLGFYDDGQVKGEIYINNTGANEIGMQVVNADGKMNYISLFAPSYEITMENALSLVNYENGSYTQKYIYHEGNKPTAEDVGAIAKSEIYQYIVTEDYTSILDWATKNPNTIGVYQGNAYEDCPFNNTHFGMIISVSNIDASYASGGFVIATGNASNEMYIRKINFNTGEWFNNWTRIGDFTSDGSVPMTGTLRVNNGYGRFLADTGYAQITTTEKVDSTDNCRGIIVKNNKTEPLKNTAQVFDKVDGTVTYYQLFGQHNTDLLASTIQSLINEGKITIN